MAIYPITALADADSPDGTEYIEISQKSASVTITATTISAQASDNSYNDSAGGFIAAGFAVGDRVSVEGFTGDIANNILVGTIGALTTAKMTIASPEGDVIADDAEGESVTISKWTSRKLALADIVSSGGGGAKVRAATTANITIATALNAGDSLDGVTLAADDLVLVKDQTSPAENGIYVAGASPARADGFTEFNDIAGLTVTVMEGTVNADKDFICTSNEGGTIGVTSLTFVDLSSRLTFSQLIGISLTSPASGELLRYNGTNWVNEKPPYDVGISRTAGVPASLSALIDFTFTRDVVFPSGLTGSWGNASIAATAQTDFDIKKNGSSVGTMRFAAAATSATFIFSTAQTFSAGDKLIVVAPNTPDATLADIAFTFAGTRS